MRMRLAEACRPFVVAMCQVSAAADHDRRQADVRTLISGAVAAARAECGSGARENYRSCLYSLTENKLQLVTFDGRPGMDEPRRRFDPNDPVEERQVDAALAIKTARGANVLFVDDLHENPPRSITDTKGRSYRTMLVAPVNAGGQHFGLFSIDSPEPKTFSEADLRFVLLIASIIAAALIQVYQDGYMLTENAEFIPRSKAETK
jgi:GAF domain-containing protein